MTMTIMTADRCKLTTRNGADTTDSVKLFNRAAKYVPDFSRV